MCYFSVRAAAWQLLFLLLLLPRAQSASLEEKVAESREWHLLLHYKSSVIGYFRSEIDDPQFFFSPNGKTQPVEELKASALAFHHDSKVKVGRAEQHPQCAYPERYKFLKKTMQLPYTDLICDKFLVWKQQFNADSISLIYAAPYLGSPASMFGHTFLKINSRARHGQSQPTELLHYGVGFEAYTGSDPTLMYALKGLLGGYRGHYYQYQYHLKVNTYNNLEARDIWEYRLSLSEEQIERLLGHLWELGEVYAYYYFLDENCSYHLLSLLEYANPMWDLQKHFNFMTVPSDTIRVLTQQQGLSFTTEFRPSLLSQLDERLKKLNQNEKSEFFKLKEDISLLNGQQSAALLDALLDWYKYQSVSKGNSIEQSHLGIPSELLVSRSKIREKPATMNFEGSTYVPPETGHKTSKISIGATKTDNKNGIRITHRPVLHDLTENDIGYLELSHLTLLKTTFDIVPSTDQKIFLSNFRLGEVGTVAPYDRIRKNAAWKIGGGLKSPLELNNPKAVVVDAEAKYGVSLELYKQKDTQIILYILTGFEPQLGWPLRYGYRLNIGPTIGTQFNFNKYLKWRTEVKTQAQLREMPTASLLSEATFSFKKFDIHLMHESTELNNKNSSRTSLNLGYYY